MHYKKVDFGLLIIDNWLIIPHPGHGEDVSLPGAGPAQHLGAFLDCGAGGEDVVDQEDAFAFHQFGA